MSVVDDYGRYYAMPMLLRAACYPLRLDKVTDADIEKWLRSCVEAGLVGVFRATDGRTYLQLSDFRQQVRAKQSKYPAPDEQTRSTCVADAGQVIANAHLGVSVFVSEGVCDAGAKSKPKSAKSKRQSQHAMPKDFCVSERVKQWAGQKGFERLEDHMEVFKQKAAAKGYAYADWDEAFMGAVRDDWAELRSNVVQHPASRDIPSPASQRRLA